MLNEMQFLLMNLQQTVPSFDWFHSVDAVNAAAMHHNYNYINQHSLIPSIFAGSSYNPPTPPQKPVGPFYSWMKMHSLFILFLVFKQLSPYLRCSSHVL
jgi:hypothetical protein